MSGDWLAIPIDEAVPMLFRMASDGKTSPIAWMRRRPRRSRAAKATVFLSMRNVRSCHLFESSVFNPDAWTEVSVRESRVHPMFVPINSNSAINKSNTTDQNRHRRRTGYGYRRLCYCPGRQKLADHFSTILFSRSI
jgi:hypothetical protein